ALRRQAQVTGRRYAVVERRIERQAAGCDAGAGRIQVELQAVENHRRAAETSAVGPLARSARRRLEAADGWKAVVIGRVGRDVLPQQVDQGRRTLEVVAHAEVEAEQLLEFKIDQPLRGGSHAVGLDDQRAETAIEAGAEHVRRDRDRDAFRRELIANRL